MRNPLNADRLVEAVRPLLAEVKALDGRQILYAAERAADVIASGADMLWLHKVSRKAEVQPDEVHHAIASGIAILAQRPGGVVFAGLHWCASGHPRDEQCPGSGEWTLPAEVGDAKTRGAVFTPRALAEEVTDGALEAVVYQSDPIGIADRAGLPLVSSVEILGLKVGDIAVGSGVFMLAACRYLADRLVEAWFDEAGHPRQELPPHNPMTLAARRLVMRCLYAVDIDPTSVELCRLSMALLTPTVPLDLTKQVLCGDSLLGITSIDQLAAIHLDPDKGRELLGVFGPPIDPELMELLMRVEAKMAKERV